MAFYHQPEAPDLMPFKDARRCPKCQSDKRMKPLYRTYRTLVVTVPRRWWFNKIKFLTTPGEHLHLTCAACQFSMDMECAPPAITLRRGAGTGNPPGVDWDDAQIAGI